MYSEKMHSFILCTQWIRTFSFHVYRKMATILLWIFCEYTVWACSKICVSPPILRKPTISYLVSCETERCIPCIWWKCQKMSQSSEKLFSSTAFKETLLKNSKCVHNWSLDQMRKKLFNHSFSKSFSHILWYELQIWISWQINFTSETYLGYKSGDQVEFFNEKKQRWKIVPGEIKNTLEYVQWYQAQVDQYWLRHLNFRTRSSHRNNRVCFRE